jgi:endothelin-converting enzyme/putative endopeptidase
MKLVLAMLAALLLAASRAGAAETTAVDPAVNPCDDFYKYACNAWIAANPIPADQSRWTRFDALSIRTRDQLHALLDQAVAQPQPDSAKVATYYGACMDEAGIEASGLTPLRDQLARIDGLTHKAELAAGLAALHAIGVNVLFGFDSGADDDDPAHDIAQLTAGGLGLPDRDYYLKDDAKSVELRGQYRAHVARMLALLGTEQAAAEADADGIIAFETELARHSLTRVQKRDPNAVFHKLERAALTKEAPDFAWDAYFAAAGTPSFARLNVHEPDFVEGMGRLIDATPLEAIRTYLRWHLVHRAAPFLPAGFVAENFSFYGQILQGRKEIEPRWRRCVVATDEALGEALGRLYVEQHFPPSARGRVQRLIADVRTAFRHDIETLPWMGAETRKRALEKLAAMAEKIAYPDKWRDYSALTVLPGAALDDDFRAAAFETRRRLAKIGGPADKSEWHMTPPTVNAYYNPQENSINFPAGILQLPFFDAARDEAANYGGLGAVAGHEMTHGFDDQGRKFDAQGKLEDWWTQEDATKFKERTRCLVDEYAGITAIDELHVNGELTLGENTADNGGLRLALAALDSLDDRQRFFLGFAQLWCGAIRPEGARLRAQTDPHSPAAARVDGTVSNMPEFAEAFHCTAGQAMVRAPSCRVW